MITFLLVIVLMALSAVVAIGAQNAIRAYSHKNKAPFVVYLMRVDDLGNIEFKRSPLQDVWDLRRKD